MTDKKFDIESQRIGMPYRRPEGSRQAIADGIAVGIARVDSARRRQRRTWLWGSVTAATVAAAASVAVLIAPQPQMTAAAPQPKAIAATAPDRMAVSTVKTVSPVATVTDAQVMDTFQALSDDDRDFIVDQQAYDIFLDYADQ